MINVNVGETVGRKNGGRGRGNGSMSFGGLPWNALFCPEIDLLGHVVPYETGRGFLEYQEAKCLKMLKDSIMEGNRMRGWKVFVKMFPRKKRLGDMERKVIVKDGRDWRSDVVTWAINLRDCKSALGVVDAEALAVRMLRICLR